MCEMDEMTAYTLRGDAKSVSDPNELCPSVEGGQCCGEGDLKNIRLIWEQDRKRQVHHHKGVLKTLRWIIGFHKEISYVAEEIIDA